MAKPPKQFRLSFQEQSHNVPDTNGGFIKVVHAAPLAFANDYKPNSSSYKDRCIKQDQWAYGYHKHTEDGRILTNYRHYYYRSSTREDLNSGNAEYVPDHLMPKIIDNEPIEGFRVQHMVARDRGNKLWRILDPRGFELEVASGTMEDLISGGIIDHGLIIGTCIWQTAKMLVRV